MVPTVTYKDDGKASSQSHEGNWELLHSSPDWHFSAQITAYGPNQPRVDISLIEALDTLISKATELRNQLAQKTAYPSQ